MKESLLALFRLYINPYKHQNLDAKKVFNYSLFSYAIFFSIDFLIKSLFTTSITEIEKELFKSNSVIIIVKYLGMLLKNPIQWFFITLVLYIVLNLFLNKKINLIEFYRIVFISFSIIIVSFCLDIVLNIFSIIFNNNIYTKINFFTFSLGNIFLGNTICTFCLNSVLYRFNILFILSGIYVSSLLLKHNETLNPSFRIGLVFVSIIISFLLLTAIPQLFIIFSPH